MKMETEAHGTKMRFKQRLAHFSSVNKEFIVVLFFVLLKKISFLFHMSLLNDLLSKVGSVLQKQQQQ